MDLSAVKSKPLLKQNKSVLAIVLVIWFSSLLITSLHAKDHVLDEHSQCQICLADYNHLPMISSMEINIDSILDQYFTAKTLNYNYLSNAPLVLSNNDPPLV